VLDDSCLAVRLPEPPAGFRVTEMDLCGIPPERLFPALDPQPHEALLLSGGTHPLSQYSFIGLDPFLASVAHGREVQLESLPGGRRQTLFADPFAFLRVLLGTYRLEPIRDLPPFWSGGIGYFSYELGRHLERLPSTTVDDLGLPEFYFVLYRSILCYEHARSSYTLFTLDFPDGKSTETLSTLAGIRSRLERGEQQARLGRVGKGSTLPLSLSSRFSREEYTRLIRRALRYIEEGDIYQVNLSHRFHTPYNGDPCGLLLRLYEINPAPFFAYLNPGPFQIISSSPERFLCVRGDRVETRPIKGTLPRGDTPAQDRINGQELLRSEKNRAELAMITDLLRNDLGRVSAYGTVRVEDPARLEAYTNVFHLVSIVTSTLAPGRDLADLLQATFPGGSITGCPKIRAMEIIDELEPTVRSVYTGSIGYVGFDGAMDLNIAIRTLLQKGDDLYFQVGGGIVYDSDPQAEYEETLHKASSMWQALSSTCESRDSLVPSPTAGPPF
jgi:para-aminobenzoate synthetase component I